ncbi:hypothetical protein F5888DRAFT_870486 [Russula emetica]|nr:hypothetical protein F5888DRAFT_870486 [Russula emetica]
MDAEDPHRLLAQTRLHCLILKVEKDAATFRARKYRKILGSLAGEDGATQLQAAGIFHMPRRALTDDPRPASSLPEGQAGSTIARCPSVRPPAGRRRPASDRTAAAVLQARSDSDEDVIVLDKEPHIGGSTSTSVLQPGSKKRKLSSHKNPAKTISTRSRPSFDIPPESSGSSTSGPRSSTSGILRPRDIPVADVRGILKRTSLMLEKRCARAGKR